MLKGLLSAHSVSIVLVRIANILNEEKGSKESMSLEEVVPFLSMAAATWLLHISQRNQRFHATEGGTKIPLTLDSHNMDTILETHNCDPSITRNADDPVCPICLSNGGGNLVKTRSCGHVFHRECIASWIQSASESATKCPCCRTLLSDDLERKNEHSTASSYYGIEDWITLMALWLGLMVEILRLGWSMYVMVFTGLPSVQWAVSLV